MQPYQKLLPPAHYSAPAKISSLLIFLFIVISLLFACHAKAQVTIKGNVLSAADETAIPFVVLAEKGKNNGVVTDVDGNFTIKVSKLPARLIFSYIGFESIEIKVKDSLQKLLVKMKEASTHLDEVVVVGYGTAGDYDRVDYASASPKTLTGKASGVLVKPGTMSKIKLRGAATTSTTVSSYRDKAITSPESEIDYSEKKSKHTGTSAGLDSLPIAKTAGKLLKRTSLLTAGEVNDFKKWKMWEDYNDTDFKIYSDQWNLFATQRYSVQLQNSKHKAIIGETVYLINKETKEIIWTAVSDNTGKAELWNGFSNNNSKQNLAIEIKNEKMPFAAIPFSQGINHIQLNRNCAVSNKVEISFVVDATGSMGDEIEYLKEELDDILIRFSTKEPSLELFTSAVFYRDKADDYITRIQPFTNNISNTIDFIKKQSAGGGGDFPEALKDALEDATDTLAWSADARTKIIFLLMDAPPHDEEKNNMAVLIAKAAAKGIRIVPVACSGTDKATEFIMRSMALATNGTYLFLTDDSGIGGGHIKPTTDEFKVELLNDLLQRTIEQMCFTNACEEEKKKEAPVATYVNTEKVKVFPNPTQGPVTLETDKELTELFVTDFTGKILKRSVVKDVKKLYKIDLSDFPSASYFIRYVTKDNKTGTEKIILLH